MSRQRRAPRSYSTTAKFQLGQRFSTAHRLRDQLRAVYNDVETVSAKQFLDELIEWLEAKHLRD
jgi:hypothetical protein